MSDDDERSVVSVYGDDVSMSSAERPGSRIKVAVRIRPLIKRERDKRESVTTEVQHDGTQISIEEKGLRVFNRRLSRRDLGLNNVNADHRQQFAYDRVFDIGTSQEDVFNAAARPIVDQVMEGYHGCIFAYGQTGSGKTHTMMGSEDDPGITMRAADRLHQIIRKKSKRFTAEIDVQYLEIYQETLIDLLLPRESQPEDGMRLREDPTHGVFVENATTRRMKHARDLALFIEEGTRRRTTAATKMNEVSSRSHAVLTVTVRQQEVGDDDGFTRMESRMHLIDLAGSERLHDTGAVGTQLKEGALINQSLTALGIVISALVDKGKHIPYRNSKLTRMLQNSLGGNSLTLVMANISPSSGSVGETISTLRFADRAKRIKNKPVQNVDPMVKRIKELTDEIRRLERMGDGGGVCEKCSDGDSSAEHKHSHDEAGEKFKVIKELLKGKFGVERADDVVQAIQEMLLEKERRNAEDELAQLATSLKVPPEEAEEVKKKLPDGVLQRMLQSAGGTTGWQSANQMYFYMTALSLKMTAPADCPGKRIPTAMLYREAMLSSVPFSYYYDFIRYQVYNAKIIHPKDKPPQPKRRAEASS